MATQLTDPQANSRALNGVANGITVLLNRYKISDPETLEHTPWRFVRAYQEMLSGYDTEPADILKVSFQTNCDQMIVVKDVPFSSVCAHHLLPFTGVAHIGYIPGFDAASEDYFVVGLSKLPRLVHCLSRRLQMQETLTQQIADAITEHVMPEGVAVVLEAHHTCMSLRGVRSTGTMRTTAIAGVMATKPEAKAEFMAHIA